MVDDEFEWDDRKAASNHALHRVSFQIARHVFRDPLALDRLDGRENYGEERYVVLGVVSGRLLSVAYTLRGDRIRILSARGAEPYEHRLYHENDA